MLQQMSIIHSAIYHGKVRHRRFAPCLHEFTYDVFMMYLDIDELPHLFDCVPFWSARRPALAWFRRKDYYGDAHKSLRECLSDLVQKETGERPDGPIRMLTNLRYFGYIINPVTFYYLFDEAGDKVRWVVADVNNTPWNERHQYVIPGEDERGQIRHHFDKLFHVSPFLPLDMEYDWRGTHPDEKLAVHMENHRQGICMTDATLNLRRKPLTRSHLLAMLASYPFMTLKVVGGIYWEALRLWLKGAGFFTHPGSKREKPVNPV